MNTISNHALTIERLNSDQWMVSCGIDFGDGQRIGINLVLPAKPDQTVAQVEQDVIRLAASRLQRLLRD